MTRKHFPPEIQGELPITLPPPLGVSSGACVLDLFAGIGGLSSGFGRVGFDVTGVDREPIAATVFESSGFGVARTCDLATDDAFQDAAVLLGGPPCRPWSSVNLQRRRGAHGDHMLLGRFFVHVNEIRPAIFVMENVPALGSDVAYSDGVDALRRSGYNIASTIVRYEEYGAPTRRRRLFTIGIRKSRVGARAFLDELEVTSRTAQRHNVRDAIGWLRDKKCGEVLDHDWSELKSIGNYRHLYESGKYGWARLDYAEPAPSFGSVAKTYILHPESGIAGFDERVVSVREVMAIMGFDLSVAFPAKTSRTKRYQMVANTVSPYVSRAIAGVALYFLTGARCGIEGSV
jgi:DNA (cytosine-5)-methyltransferase 1